MRDGWMQQVTGTGTGSAGARQRAPGEMAELLR